MISSGGELLGDSSWYMYCIASQGADEADLPQEMNIRASSRHQALHVPFATTQSSALALYVNM